MRLTSAFLLLSAMAASAQETESVTVNASALVGIWKLNHPHYAGKADLFAPLKFGPLNENFCRIEQAKEDLTINCLAAGDGRVVLEAGNIRVIWGGTLARLVIGGALQSDHSFAGHAAVRVMGITTEDDKNSSGMKMDLSDSPDKGGKAGLLRGILTDGLGQIPHETAVTESKAITPVLGGLQAIAYVGQQDRFAPPGKQGSPGFFSVYAVEFEKGERLCGLHQREDGVLDAFRCV
ncbi:MAG TPA: hypothetical protein VFI23_07710 [Rhizomicrobium sp.]|nr:hypothetical protein [Rhizomicrobium sp.]